jgi:PTS system mannose-specific IID component
MLRGSDLRRMALRTSLLQATWNYERQQGLGFAWAIQPALERLVPDPIERGRRLADHTAFFNTQPTLASVAVGAVARLEEEFAGGALEAGAAIPRVKGVLGSALAALGDRVFWLTLRPFAACVGIGVALLGSPLGGLALWVTYNLLHQTVRWLGVGWGYRGGPAVAGGALRTALGRIGHLLCIAGSVLVGLLIACLMAPHGMPRDVVFQLLLAGGIALGLVSAQQARPSPTEWAMALGAAALAAAWVR